MEQGITREHVWRNLLEYIDSQDVFFPSVVRSQINPAAEEIFDEFIKILISHRMIIPFKSRSLAYRLAYVLLWIRHRVIRREKKMPEIYVKGPGWVDPGGQSLDELERGP